MESGMAQEVNCRVRYGDTTWEGRALLEPEELCFRGTFRLAIPFASVRSAQARGGHLTIVYDHGAACFDVGPQAETWARTIQQSATSSAASAGRRPPPSRRSGSDPRMAGR